MIAGLYVASPSAAMWLRRFLGTLANLEKTLGPRNTSYGIDLQSEPAVQSEVSLYGPATMSTEEFRRISRYMASVRSTAAMMVGYARVTMQPGGDPRIVVATPLFVEYARDLSSL
jgi:hypothetical protein